MSLLICIFFPNGYLEMAKKFSSECVRFYPTKNVFFDGLCDQHSAVAQEEGRYLVWLDLIQSQIGKFESYLVHRLYFKTEYVSLTKFSFLAQNLSFCDEYQIHQMVSRIFCNYEFANFSRNWVCFFILMYF